MAWTTSPGLNRRMSLTLVMALQLEKRLQRCGLLLTQPTGSSFVGKWLFSVALLITAFSSLLQKNLSFHSQVNDLRDQVVNLNMKLRACTLLDSMDDINSIPQQSDQLHNKSLKNSALIVSLALLSIPILVLKYVDYVSNSRRSTDNILEEVSLHKQLAYRVDVFLSVHPYAKPLALLVATLLLICLGGLALFGVTDDNLADCLWLSWTYVADSGNHANSEGIIVKSTFYSK